VRDSRSRRPLLAALLATAALAAGCGGDTRATADGGGARTLADVAEAVEGLSGGELTARLAELAAEEDGRLSIYTSLSDSIAEDIAELFGSRYGVEVTLYSAGDEEIVQRSSEEASAGRLGADVIETNTPALIALDRAGVLDKPLPVDTEGIDPQARDDAWVANRYNRYAVSWNTKLVPSGAEPKRWEDLADPRWDGRLGLELGDFDWYAGLVTYWADEGKTDAEIARLFGEIARGSKVIKGHSLTAQLTASGEISVAASNYSHLIDRAVRDELPLAWKPAVEPVFLRPNGIGVGVGSARPATAALFAQWALTEGSSIYEENGWLPARGATTRVDGVDSVVLDVKAITADEERWRDEYDRLLRRGSLVEGE
jgi:iron(III) transport system substrate-binding protein